MKIVLLLGYKCLAVTDFSVAVVSKRSFQPDRLPRIALTHLHMTVRLRLCHSSMRIIHFSRCKLEIGKREQNVHEAFYVVLVMHQLQQKK